MDPDATLQQIMHLISSSAYTVDNGDELADLVSDLNEWLSKGGFLPKEWRKNRSLSPMTLTDENGLTYTRQ